MDICLQEMIAIYDAAYVSLNVRVGNVGAMSLYRDVLSFKVIQEEVDYYADNENAFEMRKYFKQEYEKIDEENHSKVEKKTGKKQNDEDKIGDLKEQEDPNEEEKKEGDDTTEATETNNDNTEESKQEPGESQGTTVEDKANKKKNKKKKKKH